jgi:hypothetical protein
VGNVVRLNVCCVVEVSRLPPAAARHFVSEWIVIYPLDRRMVGTLTRADALDLAYDHNRQPRKFAL